MDLSGRIADGGPLLKQTMIKTFGLISLSLLACVAQEAPGSRLAMGSITGKVNADDGSAVGRALVSLHRVTRLEGWRSRQTEWSLWTQNGAFTFEQLPPAEYRICVHVPQSAWLNPCEWTVADATALSVSGSETQTDVTVTLSKGAAVQIRVEDPAGLLRRHEHTSGAYLLLGIITDRSIFRPASRRSEDAHSRDYEVVVPFGRTTKVVVFSSFFRLADAAGVPLARAEATHIPIAAERAQQTSPVKLIVEGGGQ